MKKILGSVLLLTSVYASAGENYFQNAWDAKGLMAIEGSFGSAQSKLTQPVAGGDRVLSSENNTAVGAGFKLGGESEYYRLFLSGRYHAVDGYDSVTTLGMEMQYLIRAGENFNIFLGVNGGLMGARTSGVTEYSTSNPYAGVDAGANIDIVENFGVEFGVRVNKSLGDTDKVGSIDNLIEGYASLVFKFTGTY